MTHNASAYRVNGILASVPWADSTVVLSAKVGHPWVTVHFAQSTSVFKNRFSLGIYVPTPCKHSSLTYFKHAHEQTNIWNKKQIR